MLAQKRPRLCTQKRSLRRAQKRSFPCAHAKPLFCVHKHMFCAFVCYATLSPFEVCHSSPACPLQRFATIVSYLVYKCAFCAFLCHAGPLLRCVTLVQFVSSRGLPRVQARLLSLCVYKHAFSASPPEVCHDCFLPRVNACLLSLCVSCWSPSKVFHGS